MNLLTRAIAELRSLPTTPDIEKILKDYDEAKPDQHELEIARATHVTDELEIDDNASTSRGDDGVWVSAWVYVSNEELDEDGSDDL